MDEQDDDGNWHVSAIATLIDALGVSAAYTFTGLSRLTVDLNISYYSTVKTQVGELSSFSLFLFHEINQICVEFSSELHLINFKT